MTAKIIPTDDTPGAREARVVTFIDRALVTFERERQPDYTQGLKDLETQSNLRFPNASRFSELTFDQQLQVLTAMEETPFFNLVRTHTITGFFASPVHGGNHEAQDDDVLLRHTVAARDQLRGSGPRGERRVGPTGDAHHVHESSHDIKAMEFFRQKSIEILEAAGATKVWAPPVSDSRGGAHNRGTCRMGNDPNTSVVDKFHRAHDVPNLYVVDGSNLVTDGRNHPTMTIQALAFRAAKGGNLSSGA